MNRLPFPWLGVALFFIGVTGSTWLGESGYYRSSMWLMGICGFASLILISGKADEAHHRMH